MSDERKRRGEWTPLFDAWPTAGPTRGFADRVLAACDLPPPVQLSIVREPPPRRVSGSGLLLCAAIAAALILLPFAIHRRQPPPPTAAHDIVTLGNSFDLGPEHD
jgi:hypothetical protein